MIKDKDCYIELKTPITPLIKEYFEKNQANTYLYYAWEIVEIPESVWKKEPLLRKINEKFPIELIGVTKMYPSTTYQWHTDTNRGCSINIPINIENSLCLFRKPMTFNEEQYFHTELKYEVGKAYLFNNQVEHEVHNLSKVNTRNMCTIQFKQYLDELNFSEAKAWVNKMGV